MALDMTTALTIKAKVDGISQIQGLEKALGAADRQASGLSGAFGKLQGIAGGLRGALGSILPAAGIAGLGAMAKQAIDAADNLNDLSQRTGVSVETLSKFGAAAEDAGSSIDEVAKAMGRLSKGIVDPASKTNEALKSIGINSRDAAGKIKGVDQIMLELADKFSKMPDGAQKTALAMELFGKSGMNLIPMLNGGRDALSKYAATIDTEMAQNADKLNDTINALGRSLQGPFNEALTAIMPVVIKMAEGIASLAQGFLAMPKPVQDIAAGFAAVAIPAAALAIPIGALVTAIGAIATGLATVGPLLSGIPVLLAGWAGAIGPVAGALTGLGQVLLGVFTGPVGWVALAAAAGAAIYTFRDQIGEAFKAIGGFLQEGANAFKSVFIDPITKLADQFIQYLSSTWSKVVDYLKEPFSQAWEWVQQNFLQPLNDAISQAVDTISQAWSALSKALAAPFEAAANTIRGVVNQILNGIGDAIGGVVQAINSIIRGANQALARLQLPQIPELPMPQIPRFAEGGVVSGPTLAMVGEGGEPEYIVPQSKAGKFAANWMAGVRGAAAIPRFAEGGVVVPSSANVSIQTGPVTQMNGTNYVTTADLSRAVQASVNQTLELLAGDSMVRRSIGIA
jgi:hypothetical protein